MIPLRRFVAAANIKTYAIAPEGHRFQNPLTLCAESLHSFLSAFAACIRGQFVFDLEEKTVV